MNLQEFNNLKVGDKVVVARVVNPQSSRYLGDMNPELYIAQQGVVEDFYSIGGSGIEVLFEDGLSWYFNIEDINLITEKETDMQKTKTPHKHAAIIKAWADGEEIQVKVGGDQWDDLVACPNWKGIDYRIKPKFEKRYKYAYLSSHDGWTVSNEFYSEERWNKLMGQLESQKIEASGKDFQCN